jgi:hypothetical protein
VYEVIGKTIELRERECRTKSDAFYGEVGAATTNASETAKVG